MKSILLSLLILMALPARSQPASGGPVLAGAETGDPGLEKEPEFPGGLPALMQYISDKVIYPDSAFENDVQGIVTVLFTIDTEGKVMHAQIAEGIDERCNKAVLEAVSNMPAWSPGIYKGQPVSVLYRLPVRFLIPDALLESDEEGPGTEPAYRYTDRPPEFPGGKGALISYLSERISAISEPYDKEQLNDAVLEFLVNNDGKITTLRLLKCPRNDNALYLEQKLSEIASGMPGWTPALVNGRTVCGYYELPLKEIDQ